MSERAVNAALIVRALLTATLMAMLVACAWTGLALQMHLLIKSFAAEGRETVEAVWRYFAFFTLLTNALAAVVTTAWMVRLRPGPRVLATTAANIFMVGAVYHGALARLWNPQGLQLVADRLVHTATPVLFTVLWLTAAPRRTLAWRDVFWMMLYPTFYFFYALGRGAIDGFYPYWFLDLPKLGPQQMAINGAVLMALFGAVSLAFIAINREFRFSRAAG
jgi:hypothetical protein